VFAQCMENRAQSASRYLALKKQLHQDFTENQVDVYALNASDLTKIWIADHLDRGLSELQISAKFEELLGEQALEFTQNGFQIVDAHGATAISIAMDSKVMIALGSDMKRSGNLLGAFRTSVHNGKQYIIFKGNHRLRTTIRGTRYRINNPTIVKLGIGTEGLKAATKGGVYVALVVSAGVNGFAWVFDEEFGWRDFLRNMAEDVLKAALAAVAGFFAAKGIAAAGAGALVAYGVGAFVAIVSGWGLSDIGPQDLELFVEKIVRLRRQYSTVINDPKTILRNGRLKAEDAVICTASVTGGILIEHVARNVQMRINELVRRLKPTRAY